MSIWGGITGGLLGFVVLGPIGALVGSVIGSNLSSRSKRKRPNNFDKQVAFFAALFACLAKIAKDTQPGHPLHPDSKMGAIVNDVLVPSDTLQSIENINYFTYHDVNLTGDYYTNGSYGVNVSSIYRKRYNYNDFLELLNDPKENVHIFKAPSKGLILEKIVYED